MYSTGEILGIITAVLMVVTMSRILIKIPDNASKMIRLVHPTLAIVTFGFALVHAGYNFVRFGPNLAGASIVIILVIQGVLGKLSGTNPKLVTIHRFLPFVAILALVIHIFTN